MQDLFTILAIAGVAAIASPLGGAIALLHRPSTLIMSIAVGFAAGVLLATVAFELLSKALELGSLVIAAVGFVVGFCGIYVFDLFVHRWRLAGEKAEQRPHVRRFHRRHRPRGGQAMVLAGGTSVEELI